MSKDVDLSRRSLTTRIHVFQSMETSKIALTTFSQRKIQTYFQDKLPHQPDGGLTFIKFHQVDLF